MGFFEVKYRLFMNVLFISQAMMVGSKSQLPTLG